MKLKTILLFFLTFALFSCHREPDSPQPVRYSVELLYPSAETVISTDTFSVIIKINSSDTSTFSDIAISGGVVQPFQPQVYKRLLSKSMFLSPRINIPVTFINDENTVYADTIRLVYFKLKYESSFEMVSKRSNHASTVISGSEILTTGGVSGLEANALETVEIFNTATNQSTQSNGQMNVGRAGHGIFYDQSSSKVYVFGGGKRQYASDGDGEKIPNERFLVGQPSVNSVNVILDQDFAYYFDGINLFIQGGVNKTGYSTLYTYYSLNDSLEIKLLNQRSIEMGEHTLIQDPVYSGYVFFLGYEFNGENSDLNAGFIGKYSGGIYNENIQLYEPRNEHCAMNLDYDFALVSGGFSVVNGSEKILDSFELIDLKTLKTYKIAQKMSSEHASHTMCKLGNTFFILGGYNQTGNVLKSIEKFNYQF